MNVKDVLIVNSNERELDEVQVATSLVQSCDKSKIIDCAIDLLTNNTYKVLVVFVDEKYIDAGLLVKLLRMFSDSKIILVSKANITNEIDLLELGVDDIFKTDLDINLLNYKIYNYIEDFYNARDIILEDRFSNIVVNRTIKVVFHMNERVNLSDNEFKLLELFLLNKRRTLSRKEIEKKVWGIIYLVLTIE